MNLLCKSLFIKLDNGNVLTLNLEGKGNTWHCPSRSCDSDRMYRHRQLPLPSGIHNYYPEVFTILQKVGTKSIDKSWQNCARKLSEKQILLFRGSSVLRRLAEIHARWKVWKNLDEHVLFFQLICCNLPDFTSKAKWKYWIIESCQGDSGGPLIATSTRHSNSTQKRLISLKGSSTKKFSIA